MQQNGRGHRIPPEYLAVKRLSGDEDRWIIVQMSELRTVFLGSVAMAQRVTFPDLQPAAFRPHRVYVRTGAGVYVTQFRSVADCLAKVAAADLVPCFASIAINVRHLAWLETRGHQRLGGLRVGINNGTEPVPISRRHLRTVLRRLGVSLRRQRGAHDHAGRQEWARWE